MAEESNGRPKPPWERIPGATPSLTPETPEEVEEAKVTADRKSIRDLANDLRRLVRGDQRQRARNSDEDR